MPTAAHGADNLARGSAAVLVSWRHTCPQAVQSLGGHLKEDYDIFIKDTRGWTPPGCYTWYREDDILPVRGTC